MSAERIELEGGTYLEARGSRGHIWMPDQRAVKAVIDGDTVQLLDPDNGDELYQGRRLEAKAKPTRSKRERKASKAAAGDRFATLNSFVDQIARHLSPVDVTVWLVLYRDCRGDQCSASNRDLVRRTGCGLRSIARAMKRLRQVGLIEPLKLSTCKGEPSLYRLHPMPHQRIEAITGSGATVAPDRLATSNGCGATVAPVEK